MFITLNGYENPGQKSLTQDFRLQVFFSGPGSLSEYPIGAISNIHKNYQGYLQLYVYLCCQQQRR
jgi:hypothetical protein